MDKIGFSARHPKFLIRLIVAPLVLFGAVLLLSILFQTFSYTKAIEDKNLYEEKYTFTTPINYGSEQYIHSIRDWQDGNKSKLVVSDIYGDNAQELFVENNKDIEISCVSPNGNYFSEGSYGACSSLLSRKDPSKNISLEIFKTLDGYDISPSFCRWSNDSDFMVCSYVYYTSDKPEHSPLVVFRLSDFTHKTITEDAQGFSFLDDNSLVYTENNTLYKISKDNISNFRFNVENKIMLNNAPVCKKPFLVQGDKMYCLVKDSEINVLADDSENYFIKYGHYFIIAQELDKPDSDFKIINKAPFMDEVSLIFSMGVNTLLAISEYGSSPTIIDIPTGRVRSFYDLTDDETIFFSHLRDLHLVSSMPIIYRPQD
ncbi:MAG: hypothetical protein UW07_C0048G0003 [Candidatus Nomurabacteria bacterium GW2011_GWF2_43_8]|uniref:Dipeptidylpeptidase IV N-terminal domain-containing protein n=1 Tax=Candidatus Nomurabacteria bacterium GW2011_GWF2_43_8 TaxID=1618779 RepID=A0A0G1FI06_9BACT|nr:MAG: hypothetical protein UW07_C0048G0003 [Candidatus Nomurabacteria bacterium GW2011_GWF2_43_8]